MNAHHPPRRPNRRKWTIRKSRVRGTRCWLVRPPAFAAQRHELEFPSHQTALDYVEFQLVMHGWRSRR